MLAGLVVVDTVRLPLLENSRVILRSMEHSFYRT